MKAILIAEWKFPSSKAIGKDERLCTPTDRDFLGGVMDFVTGN